MLNGFKHIFAAVAVGIFWLPGCSDSAPSEDVREQSLDSSSSNTSSDVGNSVNGSAIGPIEAKDIQQSDAGTSLWAFATFVSLLVALLSVGLAIQFWRWRRRLPDGQLSVVPEHVIKLSSHAAEMNKQQISEARQRTSELNATLSEVRDAFSIFGKVVSEKDAEIDRLRSGGEKQSTIQIARRFIRVIRIAETDISEDASAGKDTRALQSILLHLTEALKDSGFESFEVEAGSDYRTARRAARGPQVLTTENESLDWQVAETLHRGFELQLADDSQVIEPAIVSIYRFRN